MGEQHVTTNIDLSKLVSDVLDHFRDIERDFFTIDEIGKAIEGTLGEETRGKHAG